MLKGFLTWILAAFSVVIWYVYLISAGTLSRSSTDPPVVDPSLATLGPIFGMALATNLGAFLGITTTLPKRGVRPFSLEKLRAAQSHPLATALASLFYVIGLGIAVGYWFFDPDRANAAEVIATALLTLGGVALGALTVLTNSKT